MIRLFVNVDHVATLREARKTVEPDPLKAAHLAEQAGAHGITVHLREDRRHIQDADVFRIQQGIRTPLNLEMAAVEEMVRIAETVLPYQVSLVPEKRQEITTEGGLDVISKKEYLTTTRARLAALHIRFSLFVDPDPKQVDAARDIGADSIEINTGLYTELTDPAPLERELKKIQAAARHARSLGLRVFAGHGLNNENVVAIAAIPEIEELNIGHNLVARSVYCGMEQAVRSMIASIQKGEALRTVSA
ncbi:pyridoxine 5'-phosphate synthase [Nitrospina watsonii]|uniref:Pyridoxine 5'-phosphate synthase n=1 Tax=Nitrospina watsonii TaxID=1323948 RepID=A0ABM9HDY4_9BACT|nr:pyridoxine 5'-phosphate synthase [Nitrospina watsonii]CAI2718413.1 pyridoxine 5'-phosphate synthase [Nitrospina watsonii]